MAGLILLFVPVGIGMAIIAMSKNPSAATGVGAISVAILVFAVMILGIAAIHPPGDYRHHAAPSAQARPL